MLQTKADTIVADPEPDPDPNPDPDPPDSEPPDPHVFGPPGSGSGSISQRYGSATLADTIAKADEYTVTKVCSFARQARLINTNRETYQRIWRGLQLDSSICIFFEVTIPNIQTGSCH
jgi:hypothetical protein